MGERQGGGMIHRTGAYLLHRGEQVVPRNEVTTNNKPVTMNIVINNREPMETANAIRRVFMTL